MKIKYVDAAKIRNTLDTDFSGYGTAEYYLYIPKGELWLDKRLRGERDFYLKLNQLEKKLSGKPFKEVRVMAAKLLTNKSKSSLIVTKRQKIKNVEVLYVDGASVRRGFDPYFELGGHHYVYAYIPKNQVWVDAKTDPADWKYTVVHELSERALMKKGMTYADAHDFALATERQARRKDGVAKFFR